MFLHILHKYKSRHLAEPSEKVLALFGEGIEYESENPDEIVYLAIYEKEVNQNSEKVVEYLKRAADQKHSYALYLFGCYVGGDKEEYYQQQAANLGNDSAMTRLGYLYRLKDENTVAKMWYEKAICLGNTMALNNLACVYQNVEGDMDKAESYYIQAADLGVNVSMYNLGEIYKERQDYDKAEKYLKQAYEKGWLDALDSLLEIYERDDRHEDAFILTYKDPRLCWDMLNKLSYPISKRNKEMIYSILETLDVPQDKKVSGGLIAIYQDIIAAKYKVLCNIAFHYKNFNKFV